MPDFERITDDLHLHLAGTPEEKAYAKGFIAGKNYARKEVLILILLMFIIVLIVIMTTIGVSQYIILLCALSLLMILSWMSSKINIGRFE